MPSENQLYSNDELQEIVNCSLEALTRFEEIRKKINFEKSEDVEHDFDILNVINTQVCKNLILIIEGKLLHSNNNNKSSSKLKPLNIFPFINSFGGADVFKKVLGDFETVVNSLESSIQATIKNRKKASTKRLPNIYPALSATCGLKACIVDCYNIFKGEKIRIISVENFNHKMVKVVKEKTSDKVHTVIHIIEEFTPMAGKNSKFAQLKISIKGKNVDPIIPTGEIKITHTCFVFINLLSAYPNMLVPISNFGASEQLIDYTCEKYFSGAEWKKCLNKAFLYSNKLIGAKEKRNKKSEKPKGLDKKYYLDAYILFDKFSRGKLKLVSPIFGQN